VTTTTVPISSRRKARARRSLFSTVIRNPLGAIPIAILTIILIVSFTWPVLAPFDPAVPRLDQVNSPPNSVYLLGGDGQGRDILSRLLQASQLTMLGALTVAIVSLVIGVSVGLIAGYFGGAADSVANWASSLALAVPSIIVLIALYPVIGASVVLTMATFGVLVSPFLFRLVRTLTRSVRQELYVDAARVVGLSAPKIMARHILAAIRGPIILTTAGMVAAGILVQAGLEFLGLGSPGQATWGGMLQDAFLNIYRSPIAVLWPGLAIGITTGSLALLANAVRDAVEESTILDRGDTPSTVTTENDAEPVISASSLVSDRANAVLSARDLVVGFRDRDEVKIVVHGISFDIRPGEVLGLVGESGSGKSQTAFAILGLLSSGAEIVSGSIQFDGVELADGSRASRPLGRRIGYVPQEPTSNLDPCETVGLQLMAPLQHHLKYSKTKAYAESVSMLTRVGIREPEHVMRLYPHEISGGMAQRVLIAGAIACGAELIIADEPTTALDVTVQAEILELLRSLQRERGLSMLLITHNLGVVADICNRVAVMRAGRLAEMGDAEAVLTMPQHPYTRALMASSLESAPVRTERAIELTGGGVR
jgi:peptide/nickel transport system permease protein